MQALREKLEARIASLAKPNSEKGWGGYVRNLPIEIQQGNWTHNLALEPYKDWLGKYVNKGNKKVWVANPIALKLHLNSTATEPGNISKYVEFTDIPNIVALNLTKTSADVIDLSDSGQGKAGSKDLIRPWEGNLQVTQVKDDSDRLIPGQIKLTQSNESKTAGDASRLFSVDRTGEYEVAFKLHSLSPDTAVYLDVREKQTNVRTSGKNLSSFDRTKKISLNGVPASTVGQTYSYKMRLEAGKLYRLNAILDRSTVGANGNSPIHNNSPIHSKSPVQDSCKDKTILCPYDKQQSVVISINARRILKEREHQNIAIPLSDREYQRQPLMNWNWEKEGASIKVKSQKSKVFKKAEGRGKRAEGLVKGELLNLRTSTPYTLHPTPHTSKPLHSYTPTSSLTITGKKDNTNPYALVIRKIQIPTTNNLVRVDVGDLSATSNAQINILPGGDKGDSWMSQFPQDSQGNYLPIATTNIKNGQSSKVFAIDRDWMQKSGGKLRLQIVLTGGYQGFGLPPGSVAGRSLEVLAINFMTQAELNRRHPNIQLVTSKQPIDLTAVQSYQVEKNSTSSNPNEPIALGKGALQRRYHPGDRGQIVTPEGVVVKQVGVNIPTGWNNWWQQVTPEHWQTVLDDVGGLGLNHVRIFVPFVLKNARSQGMGQPQGIAPTDDDDYLRQMGYLDKLKQFVTDAESKGIAVTVTLFDLDRSLPQQIDPNDPLYQEQVNYLSRIVETLKDSKYVIYDLQNEPDLHAKDLPKPEVDRLRQWLKAMAVELRNLDNDRHLIFLGTGSIEAMDRTGFLKDIELLKTLDGITIHTGSINEAIAPQIKILDRLIKDNNLGLIVKWGEFGADDIDSKSGINYVKNAVTQMQRYDLAGGDFWQYYATDLNGQPIRNEKGELHSNWGIQNKPEIRLALEEASKNYVTSIQNPLVRWRSLLTFKATPDTTPVNLPFPNLPPQNNPRVSIKRKDDTFLLTGMGKEETIYGEVISESISTDLEREKLVLKLNVSKLSGLYYLQVKVSDRYVYLVRDSSIQGDRELPLSEVLMAMGFQGKVDNVNITIGLVNTMTGAKTTAGTFAEMKMSLTKTPGNYLLKQLPGSIATKNLESGAKSPWQFDIGSVQTLYDNGTKTGAVATEIFNPENSQNYQLIQSTGDRGVKGGRRQEAGGRSKFGHNLDSDRIIFAPTSVFDISKNKSNQDGGYGTVIRQISVETPANRGEELDKKLLIWVEDMSTLNEAYLNINVSPRLSSDRQRFSHPFKIPLSKGLNEIDFTTARDDRGYSLRERLNSAKDIQGKYNFSLEYILATGQPEISSENSFLVYQAKFVDAKNKRGYDNRSAVEAFARQHARKHIKKINSTCDPRTKYLVVAGDWRMHSLFAREGLLKKSADTLQFNQRHIIIPEYDVAAVGNSRGYNSMKQLIRMLENNDRYNLDTVMTSDPYYKFLLSATGWQPADDDLTNVSTEINDMLPASPTVWHKPAQAMSVNELAPEVRNQLGLEFKASQSDWLRQRAKLDRELKAAMAQLLVQGNDGDERLPSKVRLFGKGIWSIYSNAGGLLGLTVLAILLYLLLRSQSTERFLTKVLSIRKRNIILLYLGFLAAHMTIRQWNYIWDWNTYRVQIANPAKETRYSGQSPYFSGTEGNYNPLPFWTLDLLENLHDEVTGKSSLRDRVKPCDLDNSETVVKKGIVETNFAKLHNRLFSKAIEELK
jgi:hypothetical protein